MSPEERLCDRVLELSASPGVPGVVSVHLGQAVARYRSSPRWSPARWGPAWSLGFYTSTSVWVGVLAVIQAAHRVSRALEPDLVVRGMALVTIALYLAAAAICFRLAVRCFRESALLLGGPR